MDIGGEKWDRMQERVKSLEDFLGIGESATPQTGGLIALRDDVALLKHKLGDFETLLQYFPMENLLEALRDLEELRTKLLRKTSQSTYFQKNPDHPLTNHPAFRSRPVRPSSRSSPQRNGQQAHRIQPADVQHRIHVQERVMLDAEPYRQLGERIGRNCRTAQHRVPTRIPHVNSD